MSGSCLSGRCELRVDSRPHLGSERLAHLSRIAEHASPYHTFFHYYASSLFPFLVLPNHLHLHNQSRHCVPFLHSSFSFSPSLNAAVHLVALALDLKGSL